MNPTPDPFAARRDDMVDRQVLGRGVTAPDVLAALRAVPREQFVAARERARAYDDSSLPIGAGQTISQPYIVGFMVEALGLRGGERVLEIGTGCGYAAAVLARIAGEVFTVEFLPALAASARERLQRLGCRNVHVHCGDGSLGWPEQAPFDAIAVAAVAPSVPDPLVRQLAAGGRLVIPVGDRDGEQQLLRVTRGADGALRTERLLPVRFVPLVGAGGFRDPARFR